MEITGKERTWKYGRIREWVENETENRDYPCYERVERSMVSRNVKSRGGNWNMNDSERSNKIGVLVVILFKIFHFYFQEFHVFVIHQNVSHIFDVKFGTLCSFSMSRSFVRWLRKNIENELLKGWNLLISFICDESVVYRKTTRKHSSQILFDWPLHLCIFCQYYSLISLTLRTTIFQHRQSK